MNNKIKTIIFIIGLVLVVFGADRILKMQNKINDNEILNEKNQNLNNPINIISGNQEDNEEIAERETSAVIEMNAERFESEVLKSDKTVLIDFYATWCGPCKILSPTIEEIAKENDDIKVVKIDVDKEAELAMQYGAYSIPTLVVIESGDVKSSIVGIQKKETILNMIYGEI